jgi:hypothetical protein
MECGGMLRVRLFLFAQAVPFKTAELLLMRFSRVAVQHYRFSGLGG